MADRILLHLIEYSRKRESYYFPPEITQKGISKAIESSRANVTIETKNLREKGLIEEVQGRLMGAKGKVKCYFLTAEGKEKARAMKSAITDRAVTFKKADGKEIRMKGEEALKRMRQELGLSIVRALEEIESTDLIDSTLYKARPEVRPFPLPDRFFGREKEIEEVRAMLAEQKPLVLSLMGVTGVGKTSLAARLASESPAAFFHRTHEWDSPSTIMRALAAFLKAQEKPRMSRYADRHQPDPRELALILREDLPAGLLVFDDCHKSEHVQSFLSALLDIGENWDAKIIAVSRRKPSFYNRADITVRGMVAEYGLNGLDREAARELLERTHGEMDDEAFETAYAMTEGHPMQLLLVTAGNLSGEKAKQEYVKYVHEVVVPELTPEEEEVLAHCSVYRNSFPPEGLGAVSQRTVENLLERAILMEDGDDFTIHEMVREFVLTGLRSDEKRLRRYHSDAADVFLNREKDLPRLYHLVQAGRTPEALRLMRRIAPESIDDGRAVEIADIVDDLGRECEEDPALTMIEARVSEAMGETERALDLYERAGELGGHVDRMEASLRIATLAVEMEDFRSSETFFEKALYYSQRAGNLIGEANAYRGLGMLNIRKENYEEALRQLLNSEVRYSKENSEELAETLRLLGIAHMERGELLAAERSFEKCLALGKTHLDATDVLNHLGTVQMRMRKNEEAEATLGQTVEIAYNNGQIRTMCIAMCNRANVLLELGDSERAKALCEDSLEIASKLEDDDVTSSLYLAMANILEGRGKPDKAMGYLEKSIVLAENGDRHALADRLFRLSEMKMSQGLKSEAMRLKKEGFRALSRGPRN